MLSICDTICKLEGSEDRLHKPLKNESRHRILVGLTDTDVEKMSDLERNALHAQVFYRRHAMRYVLSALFSSPEIEVCQDRRFTEEGTRSFIHHVELPTYRVTRNALVNEYDREIVHQERKMELAYGTWDDPLLTYADFIMTHDDSKYFGFVMRGLQDFDKDRFRLVNKIGKDIYDSTYGGFVIFTPVDDPSVNVHIETSLALSDRELNEMIVDEGLCENDGSLNWRKFATVARKRQQKANIHYKPKKADKKVRLITRAFPDTAHIVGLPYDISQRDEYFLDVAHIYGFERR
ncbi:MAG: hypothetical protein ACMXYE_02025 [Candidatus Woesearchaeota archaeon]